MDKPNKKVQHQAHCVLSIQDNFITRDHQKWILDAAGKMIPIQEYYSNKYGWSTTTVDSINWQCQLQAPNTFRPKDHTRILKFVHNWLPTGKRLHREGLLHNASNCQLCGHLEETNIHLFHCTHADMIKVQSTLIQYLHQDYHEEGNSELLNILEVALQSDEASSTWQPEQGFVSNLLRTGVQAQNSIGWEQLLYGRVANALVLNMEQHYRNRELSTQTYSGT